MFFIHLRKLKLPLKKPVKLFLNIFLGVMGCAVTSNLKKRELESK
jgi:hypothetical protein